MARCEECLHFEVCEALEQGNGLMKVSPIHCGYYKPTADVVPKSEVEKLRFNLESVLEEIPETKREVAREIFEDIRNTCGYSVAEHDGVVLYHTKCYSIMATKLDELEKKYTESEGLYDL